MTHIMYSGYIQSESIFPVLIQLKQLLKDPILNKTFRDVYIPSHMRATPYLVGIVTAWLKYKMKITQYKLPKHLIYIGWPLCVLLGQGTIHMAFVFYLPHLPHETFYSALYASMHHFTYSLSIGWLIIAISSGNGAWFQPILEWKPLIFLSRMTYTTFLCHGAVQMFTAANLRSPRYSSVFNIIYNSLGDVAVSYIIGFIFTMYFEAPIVQLEKLIFGKREKALYGNNNRSTQELVISKPKIKTIS